MRMYDIIRKKRDGHALSKDEIRHFIQGYTDGSIPDYQASALLMAIFLNGMDHDETLALTDSMMHSGETVELDMIEGIKVDKHSTGGVGDTTTLVLGPMIASCGINVAKMSGRGLGHTGGTIDKLESIPGFRTSLSVEEFLKVVSDCHLAVIGQTKNIAPADKLLYALRDVTATVDQISLIASSIMSKKLAAGANAIVLDVKVGTGAFLKTYEEAVALARLMVELGEGMGRSTRAVISEMSQPLGHAIGNALEVVEAVSVLKGNGPDDLRSLCIQLGADLVMMAGKAEDRVSAQTLLEYQLDSGAALETFRQFVEAQGGDTRFIEDESILPQARYIRDIHPEKAGTISAIQSEEVGIASMILGAGRENLTDAVDHAAGIRILAKIGDAVATGEPIAVFYTNDESRLEEATKRFLEAVTISDSPADRPQLIKAFVSKDGVTAAQA